MPSRRSILLLILAACHKEVELIPAIVQLPCGSDVGECRMGTLYDLDDGGTECIGGIRPVPEDCDGLDNDCDGVIDNRLPPDKQFADCPGQCNRPGVQVCSAGRWTCQSAQIPHPETCNGVDDDCDGLVDDVQWDGGIYCYTGPPGTVGKGGCHPGTWSCERNSSGWWSQRCSDALPTPETCNGIDDDCDGVVDDGITCSTPKELQVKLDWNYPNDFDTHLLNTHDGGTPDNGIWPGGWNAAPWDCFYGDETPTWSSDPLENPSLAYDDLFGPGPEVLTVRKMSTTEHYTIGAYLYAWKSQPTPGTVHVVVTCGGVTMVDRRLTLNDRQFWRIGRIWYEQGDPCHWEELGDGGMTF